MLLILLYIPRDLQNCFSQTKMCIVVFPRYSKCGHLGEAITKQVCFYANWEFGLKLKPDSTVLKCPFCRMLFKGFQGPLLFTSEILMDDICEDYKAPQLSVEEHGAAALAALESQEHLNLPTSMAKRRKISRSRSEPTPRMKDDFPKYKIVNQNNDTMTHLTSPNYQVLVQVHSSS